MGFIEYKIIKMNCDECLAVEIDNIPSHQQYLTGWTDILRETYGRNRFDTYLTQTGKHRCPECSKKFSKKEKA